MSFNEAAGPEAEFVSLFNVSVHIEHRNYQGSLPNPPLIILMHGFGANTFSWRHVMEPLSHFGEVIAYDRPAFGFTERPCSWTDIDPYGWEGNFRILDALIARFGDEREIILVGHSAGGELAADYALHNPATIDALVLVDPAILTTGGPPPWAQRLLSFPSINRMGPLLVGGIARTGDALLRKSYFNPELITQEILDGYHAPMKVKGWERAFWNFTKAPRVDDLADSLNSIVQPTVIISGDSDTVVPTSDAVTLSTRFVNSWLEVIPQCGHLPQEERPEEFMSAVARHWSQITRKFEAPGHLTTE
jgi:pimeloyl-ACP methyl ester carboxylesterase